MSIRKKIILSVSIFVTMLVAFVSGFIVHNNVNTSSPSAPSTTEQTKPTTRIFNAGEVSVQRGDNSNINFSYTPSVDAQEVSANTKAYEYIFGNTEDDTVAITLQPIVAGEGVTISYKASTTPLTFEETTEVDLKYSAQTIATKGNDIYIYILITPTDESTSVTFNTEVVWNFGIASTITMVIDGTTTTETVVEGQPLYEPETPTKTGYYFDAWFLDEEYTQLATFPLEMYGQQLHARFHNFPTNSTSYMTYSNGSYSITGNPGVEDLIIPTMYNDGTNGDALVTAIADNALAFSSNVKSITGSCSLISLGVMMESQITTVDLSSCVNLTTIVNGCFDYGAVSDIDFSNCVSLTTIGSNAFYNCALNSLDLSDCVSLTNIADSAFKSSGDLTTVQLPETIVSIGSYAFESTRVSTINIPDSVVSIGDSAFYNTCLTSIALSSALTTIEKSAFNGCTSLSSVDFSKCTNLTSIGETAFQNCTALTDVDLSKTKITSLSGQFTYSGLTTLKLPSTMEIIDGYNTTGTMGFEGTNLTTVDLSLCTNLTTIGSNAFGLNSKLANIELPSSVTTIGGYAFGATAVTGDLLKNCINLQSIGGNAFDGCTNITALDLTKCVNLETIGNGAFCASGLTSVDMTNCSKLRDFGEAFNSCSSLTSVKLPISSQIQRIEARAFQGCSALTSINLQDCNNLTSIGDSAFSGCAALTSIAFPSSLVTIGRAFINDGLTEEGNCFSGCTSLTNVDFSSCTNLEYIGGAAFGELSIEGILDLSNCTSLTTIDYHAFLANMGITEVKLPTSITKIGGSAFYMCTELNKINIEDTKLLVVEGFLASNSKVESIVLPTTVTEIGEEAFASSSNLKSITIQSNITSIGGAAFSGSGITTIDLPNSVTTIGPHAFSGAALTNIILPSSLTMIGFGAFSSCMSLTSITIPSSVTQIGYEAFYGSVVTSITFSDTSTWFKVADETNWNSYTGGTEVDVTTPSQNATWFKSTSGYWDYYWYKVD